MRQLTAIFALSLLFAGVGGGQAQAQNARRIMGKALGACVSPATGDVWKWNGSTFRFECGSMTSVGLQAAPLLFVDASYDIGASGANRPRNLWLSAAGVMNELYLASKAYVGTLPSSSGNLNFGNAGTIVARNFANSADIGVMSITSGNIVRLGYSGASGIALPGALKTPASATAPCVAGEEARDASFTYYCTATDTWKRVAIASW